MKCMCPMGGDRTCPDNCIIAAWHTLPDDQKTKERRRPIVEQLAKQSYSQGEIALQLDVSVMTVSRDLETFNTVLNVKGQGKDTLGRKKSTGRPKGSNKLQPQRRKNMDAGAETAARLILDEGKTYSETEKETGLSNIVLRSAVAREEGRREPQVERADLSVTAQRKLDVVTRQYERRLASQFEQRVRDEVKRRIDEIILPHWKEQIAQAQELFDRRKALMDKGTFNRIRRALHPDSRKAASDKVLADAFDAFMALEKYLLDERDSPTTFGRVPANLAEWDKMKASAAAARRRKRAAGTSAIMRR